MATAETKARRKEDEATRSDGSQGLPGQSPERSRRSRSSRSTRQLDFFQAMSDFRHMFPTMEEDVIEAVLRANDGAVDATIDQLLTMSIDVGNQEEVFDPATHTAVMQSFCPKYEEHDTTPTTVSEDSPPSYTEAMRSNTHQDQPVTQSIWTTPILPKSPEIQPQASATSGLPPLNLLDLDIGALASAESQISPGNRISPSLPANTGLGYKPDEKLQRNSSSTGIKTRTSQQDQNTRTKHVYRNWNPPMLGNLPDDFLRLIPPDTPTWTTGAGVGTGSVAGAGLSDLSNISPVQVSEMLAADSKPRVHKSRSKSHKVSRSFSEATSDFKSRDRDLRSKSEKKSDRAVDKMSKSLSLADDSVSPKSPRSSDKVSRSHSSRHRNWNGHSRDFMDERSPTQHSVVLETHDFSTGMLQEKMKENERRRKRTSIDMDPEMSQYLEDERLAIMLQNSEFLQELRGNDDFMQTLQRDRMNATGFEPTPPVTGPELAPSRQDPDINEGYGDDNQNTLEPFPFSQPVEKVKEEDAELRRQLKNMGKASRKQFAALARKFFRRKKKTPRQMLGEKLAPSTMNLLEDDDDEDIDDGPVDPRYDRSPEIEPLPSTLIGVPNLRTVQRPPYRPDGVKTYFDNQSVDMV